jgi:hypothetical protein
MGHLYFPHTCLEETKSCNIHINLAGCKGGNEYWSTSGSMFINYAASNDLIMLFPYVEGCYDISGTTDSNYNTYLGI